MYFHEMRQEWALGEWPVSISSTSAEMEGKSTCATARPQPKRTESLPHAIDLLTNYRIDMSFE